MNDSMKCWYDEIKKMVSIVGLATWQCRIERKKNNGSSHSDENQEI